MVSVIHFIGKKVRLCFLHVVAFFVLSREEKRVFVPQQNRCDDLSVLKEEIRTKVEVAQRMASIRLWLAFQLGILAEKPGKMHEDVRGDDLVLRRGSCTNREGIEYYGSDGNLHGRLEILMSENGTVLAEDVKDKREGSRPIGDLRVSVRKFRDLSPAEKREYKKRIRLPVLSNRFYSSSVNNKVYKVTVDDEGDVPVFTPSSELQATTSLLQMESYPDFQQDPVPNDSEEVKFAKKIVGVPYVENGRTHSAGHAVILFRRRSREKDIEFPFQAAVWLATRVDDVPAQVRSFCFIVLFIILAFLPLIAFDYCNKKTWDEASRALSFSSYSLTVISVRELLADKGSAATNVLNGVIRPIRLKQMAKSLGISVNQLLMLARLGGSWTENLDFRQLCFLGRGPLQAGEVKRNEWLPMNHYAVEFESFNKQYMLTESGVMRIVGSPGQRGGHCEDISEERFIPSNLIFENFDEMTHYLAGRGPAVE